MDKLLEKYARVILETCLKVEKGQPLFISCNIERSDFVDIVIKKAQEIGIDDIYFEKSNPYKKHDLLKTMSIDELKNTGIWNKEKWNEYAKKNAAFLMLASENPGLMKDIDSKKISEITKYAYSTRKEFDDLRDKSMISWCIAAVPTNDWAKALNMSIHELWEKIFKMCYIDQDDPVKIWEEKTNLLRIRADKLNSYNFKTLKYSSSNGTDFKVDLPEDSLWVSGYERLADGKRVLVNFPTEEVFTSPDSKSAEGIVYSSKPLAYQDNIIDNFNISFKNGKVVDYHAETGEEILREMINICENSDYLGEISLVPYDSPISNMNQVFLETLFDENAACHIALGDSFPECVKDGINIDKDTLYKKYNLNKCDSHVDFMVGTRDMNIMGITKDGKEIPIFINGNFSIEFN